MSFTRWLRNLKKSQCVVTPMRPGASRRTRLSVESIEDRSCPSALGADAAHTAPDSATQARVSQAYGQLPMSFEANQGQTNSQVNFLSHGSGYGLFLTPTAAVLALDQGSSTRVSGSSTNVLRMQLIGGNATARSVGLDAQAGTSNYFVGSDPTQWHTDIANYGRVEYQNVYRSIDLMYYGNQRQLEYDFVIAPGASPGAIQMAFQGAHGVTLDSADNLVLHFSGGNVVEHAPVIYQESMGVREAVSGHYVLEGKGRVGFEVGAYDPTKSLVIDPVLSYSTYLGGSGNDQAFGIAVDGAGNAYITGTTTSANFPTQNPLQPAKDGTQVAFVTKLNAAGTAPVYSTYLGRGNYFIGNSIAIDAAGNAYITGFDSSAFPTTPGAFQPVSGGGQYDAFVAKINSTGSALVYSTYLGGSNSDEAYGIAVDASGDAYVTGETSSSNFPTTPGAVQAADPATPMGQALPAGEEEGFVTELNPTGTALVYSSYLGGNNVTTLGNAIAVDGAGNAYVTGQTGSTTFLTTAGAFQTARGTGYDAFVTKLNSTGSAFVYSTYLGGSSMNEAYGIAVDGSGNAYVTGTTTSSDFPTTPGAFQTVFISGGDAFVTKLNVAGTALVYSTYLGGVNVGVVGYGIAVDGAGNSYLTGATSTALIANAFVAELNPLGTGELYSTNLGGRYYDAGRGIALDAVGNAYFAGYTQSPNFPTQNGIQATFAGGTYDAFVGKINFGVSATTFAISGFPSPEIAGTPGTFTVTAENVSGGMNTGYTGTVHFTSSDPLAVLQADYTFTASDQGVHTFSATLDTAGTQSIAATDTTYGFVGSETGIAVNPAAASSFILTGYPSPTNAGLAGTFAVTALDAFGNVATGYAGTVHFTSSDPLAVLPADYTFSAADNGIRTFGATLNTTGAQSVSTTDTSTSSVTGTQAAIAVDPASLPAKTFTINGFPSSTTAGTAGTITVTARDANGAVAPSYRGTIHFTSGDAQAGLPADFTFTNADQGVHTFAVTLKTAGSRFIAATDIAITNINGSESGIVVKPAAASLLLLSAPTSVTHGVVFSLMLTVEDAYGNVVTGYMGTLHFTSSDSTAALPTNYTFTAGDAGTHAFVNKTTLKKKGTQSITVTDTLDSTLTTNDSIGVV
jgi:Beta-propeller repeat